MANSAAYEAACAAHTEAFHVYDQAVSDYRSMKIGDTEYLAARAAYAAATAVFDAAFAAEAA
jgi:hypothetical protein